ncbi:MAG TPA: glycosyltransferase family 39 protein [Longimicrobiales bacterium]
MRMTRGSSQALNPSTGTADGANVPRAAPDTYRWALLLLLAAVALWYVLTLRPGHSWNDDFALYVLHARNIVEARAYGDTGYIYNPAVPYHSPQTYPPGFPLLLAPIYALFGANLFALRMVVVASLVGVVGAFAVLVRPALPRHLVLIGAALVGFQPFFVRFKNLLVPDFTFLLFLLLTLHLIRGLDEAHPDAKRLTARALLAGAFVYCAVSLRVAGIALFGAVVLYQLMRWRRPSRAMVVCVATALVLSAAQFLILPSGSGYTRQLADAGGSELAPERQEDGPRVDPENSGSVDTGPSAEDLRPVMNALERQLAKVRTFAIATNVLWVPSGELYAPQLSGGGRVLVGLLILVSLALAFTGFAVKLRSASIVEAFVLAYAGMIFVWGFINPRYLIPLIPLLFYYAIVGVHRLTQRSGRPWSAFAPVLGGILATLYVVNLARVDRSPYPTGVTSADARDIFRYVGRCTPSDARFISHRPRTIALYGDRAATSVSVRLLEDQPRYQRVIRDLRVDYVLATRNSLLDEVSARSPDFTRTYQNERYAIYRRAGSAVPAALPADCSG